MWLKLTLIVDLQILAAKLDRAIIAWFIFLYALVSACFINSYPYVLVLICALLGKIMLLNVSVVWYLK